MHRLHPRPDLGRMSGGTPGGGPKHRKVVAVGLEAATGGLFRTAPRGRFHLGLQGHPTVIPAALLLGARIPVMTVGPDRGHQLPMRQLEGHVATSLHRGDHHRTPLQVKPRPSRLAEATLVPLVALLWAGLLCWIAENHTILRRPQSPLLQAPLASLAEKVPVLSQASKRNPAVAVFLEALQGPEVGPAHLAAHRGPGREAFREAPASTVSLRLQAHPAVVAGLVPHRRLNPHCSVRGTRHHPKKCPKVPRSEWKKTPWPRAAPRWQHHRLRQLRPPLSCRVTGSRCSPLWTWVALTKSWPSGRPERLCSDSRASIPSPRSSSPSSKRHFH